jgi:hypothetical protein
MQLLQAKCGVILEYYEIREDYMDCAGRAQWRRRFRIIGSVRWSVRARKRGVALRLPPQSKFVDGITWQLATFGRDSVVEGCEFKGAEKLGLLLKYLFLRNMG